MAQRLSTTEPTTLGVILSQFKTIPAYQRDFVWEGSLTEGFVQNLYEAWINDKSQPYFIGAMVFMAERDKQGSYSIVDGQQRVTVAYLLILEAVSLLIRKFNLNDELKLFASKIKEDYISEIVRNGSKVENLIKLKHNDPTIEAYLHKIVVNNGVSSLDTPEEHNITIGNIFECAGAVSAKLEDIFPTESTQPEKIFDFIDFITLNVTAIHFVANDVSQALLIYSRLNGTGKKLGYLEIIKGLLYAKAERNQHLWDKLESLWLRFSEELIKPEQLAGKGRPVNIIDESTFLANYFFIYHNELINNFAGVKDGFLPSNKFNDFILSDEFQKYVIHDPKKFLDSLTGFAKKIRQIRAAKSDDDYCKSRLIDITLVSRTQSQPLLFLLACVDSPKLFRTALDITNRLVFIFSIYLTGSGTASKVWRTLGNRVLTAKSKGLSEDEIIKEISQFADGDFTGKWEEFKSYSKALSLEVNSQRNKIKSILQMAEIAVCRLTNHTKYTSLADFYQKKGMDVDHISPIKLGKLPSNVINSIGNSALLESHFNRGLQDLAFENDIKRQRYSESAFLFTKGLVKDGMAGDGAERRVLERITTITNLEESECEIRSDEILNTLADYFKLPS